MLVAVSLIGLNGGGNSGTPGGLMAVTPAQAAELNRIAAAAAQQSGPGKGQWLYQRYLVSEGGGAGWENVNVNFHDTRVAQQWTNTAGGTRIRSVYTSFTFDSPQDRANYYGRYHSDLATTLRDGPAAPHHITDDTDPPGPSPLATQNLSDTAVGIINSFKKAYAKEEAFLPKQGRAQFATQFDAGLFHAIVDILQTSTSERQRAAALKDIAYVPRVQMLGDRKDALGRTGLAIRYLDLGTGEIHTIIVDRKTGDLLQATTSDPRAGDSIAVADGATRYVYLQRAIVKSMTALPGGGSLPYHGAPTIAWRPKAAK
jgi:hypothetical protein